MWGFTVNLLNFAEERTRIKNFEDFEIGMRAAHWTTGVTGTITNTDEKSRKLCITLDNDKIQCGPRWLAAYMLESEYYWQPPTPTISE